MCRNNWEKWLWFIFGVIVTTILLTSFGFNRQPEIELVVDEPEVDLVVSDESKLLSAYAGACEMMDICMEEIDEMPAVEEKPVEEVKMAPQPNLGTFRITYYCCCEQCCGQWAQYHKTSTGTTPKANYTIAVDPNIIPLGTTVVIWGQEYVAEDTGAFSGNIIDIYLDNHNEGWALARERGDYAEVYLKEE